MNLMRLKISSLGFFFEFFGFLRPIFYGPVLGFKIGPRRGPSADTLTAG